MFRFGKLLSTVSLGVSLGIGFLLVAALASKANAQPDPIIDCGSIEYDLGGEPFCYYVDNLCPEDELCRRFGHYVSDNWIWFCDCA